MPSEESTLRALRELPRHEIYEEVEVIVLREFKTVLLMTEDDDLPVDTSYFDLGLTSLRLTEIRATLEDRFDLAINANVLFNEPTVDRLVSYLTDALSDRPAVDTAH
ncbi:acyl carrier protein [Streptomyces sp. NPDC088725]|uniref:acyl carrier protein n=1 Tax=Streptomyces sp. NPDC088725 TaxID=3365873 RepID=UPI0037FAA550